jgi:uncharacterized membrane protein
MGNALIAGAGDELPVVVDETRRGLQSTNRIIKWREENCVRRSAAPPLDETSLKPLKSWVAVIIGVVIAYQIATLGRQGLWYDELFTVIVTLPERSLTEIFQKDLLFEETPPLHYVLMYLWQLLAPRTDWAMRLPGLFFYILTITVATLYPCRRINTARRIAFVALMGCSFGTIFFAQEVRAYYIFGLLAVCILYDMLDHATVLEHGSAPSWARLGGSAALGLAASYTHYFGFMFFFTTILALLGYTIARGKIAWPIVALGSAVVVGFLPWIIVQLNLITSDLSGSDLSIVNHPIGVLRGFLRHLVGSPFAAALVAILGLWALFSHARAVLTSRGLRLILAVIAINLLLFIIISLQSPIVSERHLAGLRMATLLAFAFVIAEILSDPQAQRLLIATAVALFVSFVITQKPKASWREPAAYVIEHTTCDRREILFYTRFALPWVSSYYFPSDRFVMKQSNFDSGVVRELAELNETTPGCDVVAIAFNIDPKSPEAREAALAATPFRGPGFRLHEWPSAFVVRRISP